jgi:dUTP pyrophosphatase
MENAGKYGAKVFRVTEDAQLPSKPTSLLDSGWDVTANSIKKLFVPAQDVKTFTASEQEISCTCDFDKDGVVLNPGDRALFGTGLIIATDAGYEVQVRSRSGMALKHGLVVTNSPGTVESAVYRGELGVILTNTSNVQQKISKGDRIAQIVVAPVILFDAWEVVENAVELGGSSRGDAGFGNSGK